MLLWMSLAARLAPLLLMTSAFLVATRWVHDRLGRRNQIAGAAAAIAVVIAGLFIIIPYAVRMGLIVGIRYAVKDHAWPVVSQRVDLYERWGGTLEGNLLFARGLARANEHRLPEALTDFAAAAQSNDPLVSRTDAVLEEGLCLYAMHDEERAKRALLSLPDSFHGAAQRDYLLGRIAEHRGEPAEIWFRKSLAADSSFGPALYRLLRILSQRHDVDQAVAVVTEFRRANPAEANAPYLTGMLTAIQRGEVLVDYEPFRLDA